MHGSPAINSDNEDLQGRIEALQERNEALRRKAERLRAELVLLQQLEGTLQGSITEEQLNEIGALLKAPQGAVALQEKEMKISKWWKKY